MQYRSRMAIPQTLAFQGVDLIGCEDLSVRREVTEDKRTVGAKGDVVITKNTNLTGKVFIRFGLKSDGQKAMLKINATELGATGQLEVDVLLDGGFGTPAWISPELSDPPRGLWVLEAVKLPLTWPADE